MTFCLMINGSSKRRHFYGWELDTTQGRYLHGKIWERGITSLKPHTYFRYLDDIFKIWPHGKDAFSEFLNIVNTHEPPIKFKSSICIDSVSYLDNTAFKETKNNNTLV